MRMIGIRIKGIRETYKLSQTEFAERVGLETQSQISKMEKGVTLPTIDVLANISAKFNVSTDYIILGKENRFTMEYGMGVKNNKENEVVGYMNKCILLIKELDEEQIKNFPRRGKNEK